MSTMTEILNGHTNNWPIGKEFDYLGINFRVVANVGVSPGIFGVGFFYPKVKADYVDGNGIVRGKEFSSEELRAMSPVRTNPNEAEHK